MGEIRVKVTLTNAFDDILFRRKKLPAKKVRRYEAEALVDTGAIRSVIPPFVMKKLGVAVREMRVAEYADGRTEEVPLCEGILFEVMGRNTLEESLVLGNEVLLGQTFLETTDLLADCANRRLVPNPAHPDQPILKVK